MHITALLLACLACLGHSRRVQRSLERLPLSWLRECYKLHSPRPLEVKQLRSNEHVSTLNALTAFLLATSAAVAFNPSSLAAYLKLSQPKRLQSRTPMVAGLDADSELSEDWRDVRARLVARERGDKITDGSYVYHSPLIEAGTILLDAEPHIMDAGCAGFHKAVLLMLEADTEDRVAVILNRPTGMWLDGWHFWYGGPVGEGGAFEREGDAMYEEEPQQILCLHSLESEIAKDLSFPVLPGIWGCEFDDAQELLERGVAKSKDDFRVFVGYAAWDTQLLADEIADGAWATASADSATVLQKLLKQRQHSRKFEVPEGIGAIGDGIDMWDMLMTSIGHGELVESSRNCQQDRMLIDWIQYYLADRELPLRPETLTIDDWLPLEDDDDGC